MNPTLPTPDERPGRGRRTTAIGVTAGLLGGGAIGLLMTMPSLTSAATDAGSAVEHAEPVIALQDDTTPAGSTDAPVERPDPGERLREVLQPLVDDGTITSEQAGAVADHLVEQRPERRERGHHRRGHHGPGRDGEVLAGLLGIDTETLRDELRAGNSIADIAAANDVDVQTVVDALVDGVEERLATAVENGRLTDDEAAERLAEISEKIEERVNTAPPARG